MSVDMSGQARLLQIVELLVGQELTGLANKDLMTQMGVSASMICRDLAVLEEAGWVERKTDGRSRIAPKFASFAQRIAQGFRTAQLNLKAEESRYQNGAQHE